MKQCIPISHCSRCYEAKINPRKRFQLWKRCNKPGNLISFSPTSFSWGFEGIQRTGGVCLAWGNNIVADTSSRGQEPKQKQQCYENGSGLKKVPGDSRIVGPQFLPQVNCQCSMERDHIQTHDWKTKWTHSYINYNEHKTNKHASQTCWL